MSRRAKNALSVLVFLAGCLAYAWLLQADTLTNMLWRHVAALFIGVPIGYWIARWRMRRDVIADMKRRDDL